MALFQDPWRLEHSIKGAKVSFKRSATSQSAPPFLKEVAKQQQHYTQALEWPQITNENENRVPKLKHCSRLPALPLTTLSARRGELSSQKDRGHLYRHNPTPATPCSQNLTCRGNASTATFQTCLWKGFPFLPTLLQPEK